MIKIIKKPIKRQEIVAMAKNQFGDLIKIVVDIKSQIMAVGGEVHAEEEALLVEKENSQREHTWGINLWPEKPREDWVEFDSVINLKPYFNNRSRGVKNPEIREIIKKIIDKLILD